jgi:2-dehydro-3-deoxy-D-arabinonate dehydratase
VTGSAGEPRGIFRLALPDGSTRIAVGRVESGPETLLEAGRTIASLLADGVGLSAVLEEPLADELVPPGATVLAPVDDQEIWAAGVTYLRSRDARMDESTAAATAYDLVYNADRPELFMKSVGWRVRGPGAAIGIRADSSWDVPEPELALVIAATGDVVGYAIGNDVSSRSIEGENPLYLPQAKTFDGACALGPCLVPATEVAPPFAIRLEIERDGSIEFAGETTTAAMRRDLGELAGWLVRAYSIPAGAVLLTGTGIVPPDGTSLRPRDRVRISIAGLGTLENVVETVGSVPR